MIQRRDEQPNGGELTHEASLVARILAGFAAVAASTGVSIEALARDNLAKYESGGLTRTVLETIATTPPLVHKDEHGREVRIYVIPTPSSVPYGPGYQRTA